MCTLGKYFVYTPNFRAKRIDDVSICVYDYIDKRLLLVHNVILDLHLDLKTETTQGVFLKKYTNNTFILTIKYYYNINETSVDLGCSNLIYKLNNDSSAKISIKCIDNINSFAQLFPKMNIYVESKYRNNHYVYDMSTKKYIGILNIRLDIRDIFDLDENIFIVRSDSHSISLYDKSKVILSAFDMKEIQCLSSKSYTDSIIPYARWFNNLSGYFLICVNNITEDRLVCKIQDNNIIELSKISVPHSELAVVNNMIIGYNTKDEKYYEYIFNATKIDIDIYSIFPNPSYFKILNGHLVHDEYLKYLKYSIVFESDLDSINKYKYALFYMLANCKFPNVLHSIVFYYVYS